MVDALAEEVDLPGRMCILIAHFLSFLTYNSTRFLLGEARKPTECKEIEDVCF